MEALLLNANEERTRSRQVDEINFMAGSDRDVMFDCALVSRR